MFRKDRYRLLVTFSFIILIIFLFVLFITLWNKYSQNPEINISNIVYLYLLIILAAAVVMFLINIFQANEIRNSEISLPETPLNESLSDNIPPADLTAESFFAPDIDIDELAINIIPKIDFKERIEDYAERILQNLAKQFELVLAIFYLKNEKTSVFQPLSTFAWSSDTPPASFIMGEGLTGQVAKNKVLMKVDNIPDDYINILSGLGSGSPKNLLIVPLLLNKETIAIIELASFKEFDKVTEWTVKYLAKIIANSIITKLKAGQGK
jgi:putative methionine-R-sulfoxide reductase with GAF domain